MPLYHRYAAGTRQYHLTSFYSATPAAAISFHRLLQDHFAGDLVQAPLSAVRRTLAADAALREVADSSFAPPESLPPCLRDRLPPCLRDRFLEGGGGAERLGGVTTETVVTRQAVSLYHPAGPLICPSKKSLPIDLLT